MIIYVATDLFQSPALVLVNTVNTVGVMGKGIAKEFKHIYPEMFERYQQLCERGQFQVGQLWLYKTPHKWILNFPTKKHWRNPSTAEYIETGLQKFAQTYANLGITSISFPLLGCGNGELDWEKVVKPIMERHLKELPIKIFIHVYRPEIHAPEHRDPNAIKTWLRNEPEALGFIEIWEDLAALLQKQNDFSSLDGKVSFSATMQKEPEDGILFIDKHASAFIPREALLDLWQHIRGAGFSMEGMLPAGLDRNAQHVLALMSHLPYLKPVALTRELTKTNRFAMGLQFVPRSIKNGKVLSVENLQRI